MTSKEQTADLSDIMLSELNCLTHNQSHVKALPEGAFPLTYKHIMQHQQKDKSLLNKLKKVEDFDLSTVCKGRKEHTLIAQNGKIIIPQSLQKHMIEWYHNQLCHPGMTRTEVTI